MTMTISSHNLTISWESDLQGEEVGDPPSLMTACFVLFFIRCLGPHLSACLNKGNVDSPMLFYCLKTEMNCLEDIIVCMRVFESLASYKIQ